MTIDSSTDIINGYEAATLIGTSYWTLLQLVKQGQVPHFKIGRRIVFRRTALEAWMSRQEEQSTAISTPDPFDVQEAVRL